MCYVDSDKLACGEKSLKKRYNHNWFNAENLCVWTIDLG